MLYRKITEIIVHCSATPDGRNVTAADIDLMHRQRGWRCIGYHLVVDLDGLVEQGRPLSAIGAHALGHNAKSIGVCYVGGLDAAGRPADTRTPAQRKSLRSLLENLHQRYPDARILGHRDCSPDRNHDGKITPDEWLKACPCFDAAAEYADLQPASR